MRREPSPDNPELREEMYKIAERIRGFGYPRVGIMPGRKGMIMNEIVARIANDPVDRLQGGGLYQALLENSLS